MELIGSWGARDLLTGISVSRHKRKLNGKVIMNPVPILARKLLANGEALGNDRLILHRNGEQITKQSLQLIHWAQRDCLDHSQNGPYWVKEATTGVHS